MTRVQQLLAGMARAPSEGSGWTLCGVSAAASKALRLWNETVESRLSSAAHVSDLGGVM